MKCRTIKAAKTAQKPRLLRIPKALRYLDNVVTEGTLRNWICAGRIPVVRIGGIICISTDVLDDLKLHGGARRDRIKATASLLPAESELMHEQL
jgi:hypothetical protein